MSRTILIVEDDRLLAEVYKKSLAAAGLNTMIADNSGKALKIIRKSEIKLVILDIVLNNENGFDVLKQLRRLQGFSHTPIIIVTGLNTDEIEFNKELKVSLNICGIYTKTQLPIARLVEEVKNVIVQHERN